MAENKKSFVAYADWKETFDNLPDELAGKLIKHIFAYVNDENPIAEDFVIKAVFSNIKNTLKRDLKKWESQLEQRREAGKRSAQQRALTKSNERSISLNETQRNSTVSDSVSVSDSVILLEKETKTKNDLIFDELIISDSWIETVAINSKHKFNPTQVKSWLKKYTSVMNTHGDIKNNKKEFCSHFVRWLDTREKKEKNPKTPLL